MSVCPGKLKSRERERMDRGLGRTQVWWQKRKIYNALQALGWGCVDQWMGGWVVWELINFPDLVRWAQAKWYLSLFHVFLKHSKTLGSPTYESKGVTLSLRLALVLFSWSDCTIPSDYDVGRRKIFICHPSSAKAQNVPLTEIRTA